MATLWLFTMSCHQIDEWNEMITVYNCPDSKSDYVEHL